MIQYTHLGVKTHLPDRPSEDPYLIKLGCASYGFLLNRHGLRNQWVSWYCFSQLIAQYSSSRQAQAIAHLMSQIEAID